jgi:LysM repeat protein
VPRIAVLVGALAIAALALFMLPALLGIGGGGTPAGSHGPSQPVATPSAEITPQPAPTAQVYVIKQKDTLSKVATRFGITLDELLAANPDIKNPDKISIGQQIIIPLPVEGGAAPSDSAAP